MQLQGQTALVTGAAGGIGRGVAVALARAGADVAVADLDHDGAKETVAQVEAEGRRGVVLAADVTDVDSVAAMVADAEAELGPLDIAVNNAGLLDIKPIEEMTGEDWDRLMAVNAKGVFLCTQAEVASMRQRQRGRIVNVASIAGKAGFPTLSHYCASKFAVVGFTNSVAKEVATEGITINALCPGIVGTGMWLGEDGLSRAWAEEGESEEESWARHQETLLPQGEAQTVEDMGDLVVFLASSPHITGQAIAVDGGATL